MSFANSKISVYNWVIGGLMALTFIVFAKIILNKWKIPGATEVVNMA